MNSIANILPVEAVVKGSFAVDLSYKKAKDRAHATVLQASNIAKIASVNVKGAMGNAARNQIAGTASRAIAEAILAGNYQPATEAILMRSGMGYLNIRNRAEWIGLEAHLEFALETAPQTYNKKGDARTGKGAVAEDTLLFYRSLNALVEALYAERKAAKESATDVPQVENKPKNKKAA